MPRGSNDGAAVHPPFLGPPVVVIKDAPNVFLDTLKRGDDDDFSSSSAGSAKTITLRFYEAYGGHARAKVTM